MSQSPLLFEVGSRTSSRVCLEYMFFIRGVLDNLPFWPEEKAGTSEASASPSANSSTQPAWPVLRPISHIPAAKPSQPPGGMARSRARDQDEEAVPSRLPEKQQAEGMGRGGHDQGGRT